tara:strand:+ start:5747 stop:6091 length:345 start_codon:yes stop_codon:yes gene_type:complete
MVDKTSWETKEIPISRRPLGYSASFSESDAATIMAGHIPKDMDDKWFIYSEGDWIYFVRSWTGFHIYGIRLADSGVVSDSWVSLDSDQHRVKDSMTEIDNLEFVIKRKFNVQAG